MARNSLVMSIIVDVSRTNIEQPMLSQARCEEESAKKCAHSSHLRGFVQPAGM
eukprot:m.73024 g.73024  ORF g.73024 m.73024 type:complete len:53 (+) comp10186_c0_seq2:3105-3263(+)